jgi:hypothetical protein
MLAFIFAGLSSPPSRSPSARGGWGSKCATSLPWVPPNRGSNGKRGSSPTHLPMSANVCQCLPMSANVCQCLPISANLCQCLPVSASVCQCLPFSATVCQSLPFSAVPSLRLASIGPSRHGVPFAFWPGSPPCNRRRRRPDRRQVRQKVALPRRRRWLVTGNSVCTGSAPADARAARQPPPGR